MKIFVYLLLVTALILGLALSGCSSAPSTSSALTASTTSAKPAATSTSSTPAAPASSTTPTVAPVATVTPAAPAKEHEPFQLNIYGNLFGSSSYTAAFVLGDIINKNSTWLKAKAIETSGAAFNTNLFATEPQWRKNSIMSQNDMGAYLAKIGEKPMPKYNGNLKALFSQNDPLTFFVARDPNIKSGKDFAGKKIGLVQAGGTGTLAGEMLMKNIWNVWDQNKIQYLGFDGSPNALKDGTVDVAIGGGAIVGGKFYATKGYMPLVESTVDFHYVNITDSEYAEGRAKTGYPIYGASFQPGFLSKQQKEVASGWWLKNGYYSDAELPDDVVYEICRIVYSSPEAFGAADMMLKDIGPKTMAQAAPEESYFHPGAIKFYKDKGIKIGF